MKAAGHLPRCRRCPVSRGAPIYIRAVVLLARAQTHTMQSDSEPLGVLPHGGGAPQSGGGGGPSVFALLASWYARTHAALQPLNDSKFFAGLIVVMLNLSVKLVDVRLSKPMLAFFQHSFSRQLLLFAMIWVPTRDTLAALVLSTLIILVIDFFTNDESGWCALPASFVRHHRRMFETLSVPPSPATTLPAATAGGGPATTPLSSAPITAADGAASLEQELAASIAALQRAQEKLAARKRPEEPPSQPPPPPPPSQRTNASTATSGK